MFCIYFRFNLESDEESNQEDQFNLRNDDSNSSNDIGKYGFYLFFLMLNTISNHLFYIKTDNLKPLHSTPKLNLKQQQQQQFDSNESEHLNDSSNDIKPFNKTLIRKIKKSQSFSSQKQTNTLFKTLAKRTSLCLNTAINIINPSISHILKTDSTDMNFKSIKSSRKGSFTKSNSSGQIHVKSYENKNLNLSQIDMNNSGTLNKPREFRPFESRINKGQETIIEECKNSLNELIKASKWPDKVKQTSENYGNYI